MGHAPSGESHRKSCVCRGGESGGGGTEGKLEYDGHSRVVDYLGRTVTGVADSEEGVAVAEIDLSRLRAFRRKFPALDDADRFTVDL